MALLSATQGTPERLWSLMAVLDAHGGALERTQLQTWMNPRFVQAGGAAREDKSAVDQTVQAAAGIGLVTSDRQIVSLAIEARPKEIDGFGDLVHRLLSAIEGEADADIFDAYACLVVQTEILGSRQWLTDWTARDLADFLSKTLTPRAVATDDLRFNQTRPPVWRRWLEFVGLLESFDRTALPSVTIRLQRALAASTLPRNGPIPADTFLAWVAQEMPYLEGGRLFLRAAARMDYVPPKGAITRLLSSALRDLADDDLIGLIVRGDAQDGQRLASDRFSDRKTFNAILLKQGIDQDA